MSILNYFRSKKHPLIVIILMLFVIGGMYVWNEREAGVAFELKPETQTAQVSYQPLAPLPSGGSFSTGDVLGYLQNLLFLGIGIAVVLAVLMIVIGGVQYMGSDAFTNKEDAKKKITMAVGGLIIALGGYLLLYVINPALVTFKLPAGSGRNIQTIPSQVVQKVEEAIKTGTNVVGEDLLGRKQDIFKITNFPPSTGKYFEAKVIGNVEGKDVTALEIACDRLKGKLSSTTGTLKNLFGTRYACNVKK